MLIHNDESDNDLETMKDKLLKNMIYRKSVVILRWNMLNKIKFTLALIEKLKVL